MSGFSRCGGVSFEIVAFPSAPQNICFQCVPDDIVFPIKAV